MPPAAIDRALRASEDAFGGLDALKLPHPLADAGRGGDTRFDVYLDPQAEAAKAFLDVGTTDAIRDSASAFVVAPPSTDATCAPSSRLARAISEAMILGLDGSTDPGVLAMAGSYLGTLVAPCSTLELEDVDTFQRAPDRCLADDGDAGQPGSFLFPAYLDERYGAGGPGAMITSLVAISDQPAPPDRASWPDKPTVFDALRSTFKARGMALDDVMLDFAVARAFIGSRSDSGHMADVDRFGDLGRVRVEWSVPFASLPRRLAPTRPLDALGASYIWLDLKDAPKDAELSFLFDWELPFLFRWSLVKVAKDGSEITRVDVAPIFGDYHAERTVRDLGDVAGILIVAENDGDWSKSQPFEPGESRLLPKSFTVTVRAGD